MLPLLSVAALLLQRASWASIKDAAAKREAEEETAPAMSKEEAGRWLMEAPENALPSVNAKSYAAMVALRGRANEEKVAAQFRTTQGLVRRGTFKNHARAIGSQIVSCPDCFYKRGAGAGESMIRSMSNRVVPLSPNIT